MKLLILSALCIIAAIASPVFDDETRFVNIPDGFDGIKRVNLAEEQEATPLFNVAADTRFLVFTRFNPTIGQPIAANNIASVLGTNFSPARPTRILIHGWQSNVNADVNILTTAAYLRNYDVNVIVVDWAVGANTINYISSRNNVAPVGRHLAEFLNNMQAAGHFVDFSRISCVGHSLGAHICGHAGKNTRLRINTIIGLDPAGPLFDANNPSARLDAGDAEYVEVIHTDTQSFGIGYPIGDADFYPNGGSGMPGCLTQICDHSQVVPYFVESLNSDRLWGRRCSNFDQMNSNQCTGAGASMGGEPSNARNNLVGIFRMPTNANSPFGIGQF